MALRFAPIIRVSTEQQEKKGESLRTQTAQVRQYVKSLGGVIPDHCWRYSGQEHATPGQERQKLDKLLADSSKGLFDAVIVCDASRWSRDNLKSKTGLETLRANGRRFFVGTMEYDLFNPEHSFFLGMSAEIGELQAKQQALKSITNRIERAKRGRPSSGKLPFGRTWSEEEGWGLDAKKAESIRRAAQRYLDGEGAAQIASSLGMNLANFWKILNHRSGTKWQVHFRAKHLNIDETVEIAVPPLLDEQTIEAIHERARANRTYLRGELKYRWLLGRMVFCAHCGYALFGQVNHGRRRYYRHPQHRKDGCSLQKWVPADLIENSVLLHLIQTFGDVELIRRAVERATPDMAKVEALTQERADMGQELKNIANGKDRVVGMVADGLLSKEEVKARMEKLRARESHIQERLSVIEAQLESTPDPAKVRRLSKLAVGVLKDATANRPAAVFEKPYKWKRNLVEHAFSGRDAGGRRLGVYVGETGNPEQPWSFEVRGMLESTVLGLPLPDDYLEEAFYLDAEFHNIPEELRSIRAAVSQTASRTPCTSRPRCSSTTTRGACTATTRGGWRRWPPTNRSASTCTTARARTTATPTSSAR